MAIPLFVTVHFSTDGLAWEQREGSALAVAGPLQGSNVTADGQGLLYGWTPNLDATTAWTAAPTP